MPHEPRVYLLSPQKYRQEVIAVAFAKTSRSPEPFDVIAEELSEPESARFHEKWVIGYGHASVAEHAVLHLALEGVSRLAIEALQSSRLGSYTEKSTRYQKWDPEGFVVPPELAEHPLREVYLETVRMLFATYAELLTPVREVVRRRYPPREGEDEARWDRRIRSRYVDACRYLLPAAAQANVGVTMNARTLAHTLRKMLSHPLAEVRRLGERMREVALAEAPTLVRYVEPVRYWQQAAEDLSHTAYQLPRRPPADWCTLVHYDADGELRVLAAALYRFGQADYATCRAFVEGLDSPGRLRLAWDLLGRMDEHDIPLRELEYATYTFDLVMDQGAYYEFKRHRMMTQTPQQLTADLGYAVPRLIVEAGVEARYREAMERAAEAYRQLAAWNPQVAAYVVPNGFNRRVLAHFNLREAYHWLSLRAAPNAHFAMRRVALRVAEEIRRVHPTLMAFLRLPEGADWRVIEAEHFAATA